MVSRPTPPPLPGPVPLPPDRAATNGTTSQSGEPRVDRVALEQEFVARMRERWRRGAEAYGDESFRAAPATTVGEILAEVEDVAGWAFVLWVSLRARLHAVADSAATFEALHRRAVVAERERDALRARLDEIAQALDAAPAAPSWATVTELLGSVRRLVAGEAQA